MRLMRISRPPNGRAFFLDIEGDDMDVLLRMLLESYRWDGIECGLPRRDRAVDRSRVSGTPRTRPARAIVPFLLRFLTVMAPVIVALATLSGCAAFPGRVSEASFVTPVTDRGGAVVLSDVAGQYWKREPSQEIKLGPTGVVSIIARNGPPDEELARGCRVVITEFNVEFVDVQFPNPFGKPTAIRTLSAEVSEPARTMLPGIDPDNAGAGLRPVAPADEIETAQALRECFEAYLHDNGLIVIPREAVIACASYARLQPAPTVSSSWALFSRSLVTDTGVVLRLHTVAAPGLGVATCSATALAAAEAQIRRDTGADIVMAVKLRVGTYHGSAALEQDSTIRWTSARGPIVLTARKALGFDAQAADAKSWIAANARARRRRSRSIHRPA